MFSLIMSFVEYYLNYLLKSNNVLSRTWVQNRKLKSYLQVRDARLLFSHWRTKTAMVSIRRRKLLGLCSGHNYFLDPVSPNQEQEKTPHNAENTKPVSVHPLPLDYSRKPKEVTNSETGFGKSNVSAASSASIQHFPEVKRRKRHRRKHIENQEPCIMRGVYFKNLKWQAAIKVDKKQIHLGTVGSQEEAARLYDRAAFMCGREPNFELSEQEKQELRKFNWDEFLTITRSAITNKKTQRRSGTGLRRKLQDNDWEGEQGRNGLSASEDEAVGEIGLSNFVFV